MVSHSQNLEDVLLDRAFAGLERGFYVDVGANDPEKFSVTKHFYDHGWSGINIEPGAVFEKLARARPRDTNLRIAVSDEPGTLAFHEYPNADGLSTLEERPPGAPAELLAGRVTRTVQVRPLRDVFAEYQPPQIDFLSIDVEGHERRVIRGNNWTRWRPRVVVVEATEPLHRRPTYGGWEAVLLTAGYLFAHFDGLNRYYVRHEDEELLPAFAAPANVFDEYLTAYTHHLLGELRRRDRLLDELRRGTGERTLRVGLWLARQLYRVSRGAGLVRRLLRQRPAA
jgi:FkbM family methyltransferase